MSQLLTKTGLIDLKHLCRRPLLLISTTIIALSTSMPVSAKVPLTEAKTLGQTLTPMGAEKSANADNTIPEWTGGITSPPADYNKDRQHTDPFAEDKLLFTIDQSNYTQYQDQLSPGQIALLKAYPTWKMHIYPTRRSASYPQFVYDATMRNATEAVLSNTGFGVENSAIGVPFPIPKSALEVVFNHIMRWRGERIQREVTQAVPTVSGAYTPITFKEEFIFDYGLPSATPTEINKSNLLFYFKQSVTAPARLAGSILLVHETINQQKDPRRAWVYNAGQRRVRRAPNVAYDNPGTASDGMRTNDNFDMYNGSPDRYDWKLIGKKELFIPYNSYQLHSDRLSYDDILQAGHINPTHARYEKHRVWQVEGTLKQGTSHLYAKRVFFIDEDTWQISVADHYDSRDQLWRVAEAHMLNYYQVPVPWHTLEVLHDLQARRYLVLGLDNDKKPYDFEAGLKPQGFRPSALRRQGLR